MTLRTTRPGRQSVLARSFGPFICLLMLVPFVSRAQSADEAAVRHLAERFFDAYQNTNLKTILPLWSEKSPNLTSAKETFERVFGENKIELESLTFRKISVGDGKASVRVVAIMSGVDLKTGSPASIFGKMNRTLNFVKEGDDWKVWGYVLSEQDLAASLESAQTDEARKALLAGEQELVTVDLARELLAQGRRLQSQANYPAALVSFGLAASVSETIGDLSGVGSGLSSSGAILAVQGRYAEGVKYQEKSFISFQKAGDKMGMASALRNAGSAELFQGHYKEARACFENSLKIAEETRNDTQIAAALNGLGNLHKERGEYKQALEYFERCRGLAERSGDKLTLAVAMANIGAIYDSQGDTGASNGVVAEEPQPLRGAGRSQSRCSDPGRHRRRPPRRWQL